MFSQQAFAAAQHIVDILPVEFPQNTSQVMAVLARNRLMHNSSMRFVANSLRQSALYRDIKTKFDELPEQMTEEELVCYAVGTALNGEDLENVLKSIAAKPELTERFTDPVNFSNWYEYLPNLIHPNLSQFYFTTERYKAICAQIDTDFMALTPQEFFFVALNALYYIQKHRGKVSPPYTGRFLEYIHNSNTLFNFICHAPRYSVLQIAYQLRFHNSFAHLAGSEIFNPKSDAGVVLAAMFARDIKKLDVDRVRAAIANIKAEYKGMDNVIAYMHSLEASLSFADIEANNDERAAKIQIAAKNKIYINLSGASLEGLDLHGTHLEYALIAPEQVNHNAKWKEIDRAAMREIANRRAVWREIDPAHFVNLRGCDLRNTQLPYCMGMAHVSLCDAKLDGSTIFEFPFLSQRYQLNHSIYECGEPDQIAPYINSQLTRMQQHIALMFKAPLLPQFTYVAKTDKDEPTGPKGVKSKHVAAKLMAQYILAAEDEETAQIIYDAAFNHPCFAHTNKVTALANKALLFVTPQALKSLNITKYSDSQDALYQAMDKREFLLAQHQQQELRNVMN